VLTWIGQLFGSSHPAQPDWISSVPKLTIIIPLVWQWTPFMMLILLAGLQGQPRDPLEAAKVDGASDWQAFRYVTLPHMRTYIELAMLLGATLASTDPATLVPAAETLWRRWARCFRDCTAL